MKFLIVDVQGFKNLQNEFIIKEIAIATTDHTQTFLIKPPYSYIKLTKTEKQHVSWIEKNRGFFWSEGYIDYREFKRIIFPYLNNKNILVKGNEKKKWVGDLCENCTKDVQI